MVLPVSTEPGDETYSEACKIDSVRVVLPESTINTLVSLNKASRQRDVPICAIKAMFLIFGASVETVRTDQKDPLK